MSIEPSPLLEVEPSRSPQNFEANSGRTSRVPVARNASALNGTRFESNGKEAPHKRDLPAPLRERIKELVQLAREQGYLTREDVQEVLSGDEPSAEDLEEIFRRLRSL